MNVFHGNYRRYAEIVCLSVLLIFSAALRIYKVDFGLPTLYHPDERMASIDVRNFMHGDFLINRFNHPAMIRNLAFTGLKIFSFFKKIDPDKECAAATLALRLLSVVSGTLAVLALYFLARKFVPCFFAFTAAWLYTVIPLTVFNAKYGVPDTILSLLFILILLVQIKLYESRSAWLYFLNGFILTVAFFTKYNACFLFFSFLTAHVLGIIRESFSWKKVFDIHAVRYFLTGVLLGVLIGFPFFQIRKWEDVFATLGYEADRLFVRADKEIDERTLLDAPGSVFLYCFHFRYSILPAVGIPLFVCIVLGLIRMAMKRSPAILILYAGLIPYYCVLEFVNKVAVNYDRYVLPVLSLYLIAAMVFCEGICRYCRTMSGKYVAMFSLAVVLSVYPIYKTARYLAVVVPDTREQMKEWIVGNIPKGSTIFMHWARPSLYPDLASEGYKVVIPPHRTAIEFEEQKRQADYILSSTVKNVFFTYPDDRSLYKQIYGDELSTAKPLFSVYPSYETYLYHNPVLHIYKGIKNTAQ